jgi:hypothetical protein
MFTDLKCTILSQPHTELPAVAFGDIFKHFFFNLHEFCIVVYQHLQ